MSLRRLLAQPFFVLRPLVASLCLLQAAWGVEIISHRGESADAPENTMAAFELAWERGVPAIELDVHLTSDGRLLCIHDADTKRTTGEKLVVKQSTLAELQKLDAGSWKGEQWAGESMPTLEQALASIPEGSRCFIEVKVGPEANDALVKAIKDSGKSNDQLCVISFKADTIARFKQSMPEIKAYYLASFKQNEQTGEWTPTASDLIARAKRIQADGLDLSYNGPIDKAFVKQIRDAGLEFYVWTIDDLPTAKRYVELGVDGITTNKGRWMMDNLPEAAGNK